MKLFFFKINEFFGHYLKEKVILKSNLIVESHDFYGCYRLSVSCLSTRKNYFNFQLLNILIESIKNDGVENEILLFLKLNFKKNVQSKLV